MLLLTAAFFIVPPFLQLIKRWLSSFQHASFPAITYNPFVYLNYAHQCPQTLTVWWRNFLCSMVERIDYGQEASLSKVRHEHSVIKDRRRVHYCRTGCWCLQGHSHPAVIMLCPTPTPNHVAILVRVFHSRSNDYEQKTLLKRWWREKSSIHAHFRKDGTKHSILSEVGSLYWWHFTFVTTDSKMIWN